jgi:hypothetical protein
MADAHDQVFYKAHGSAASWEWLEMIAPCVNILRHLANEMHGMLGTDQGTKHTPPDLSDDIRRLMKSLGDCHVYEKYGRTFTVPDDIKGEVEDVIKKGLKDITGPLREYNRTFANLQDRCRMPPVVTGPPGQTRPPDASDDLADTPPSRDAGSTGTESMADATLGGADADEQANGDAGEQDSDSDDDDEVDELTRILDAECAEGRGYNSDMLTLETAADVAFDMDLVEHDDMLGGNDGDDGSDID